MVSGIKDCPLISADGDKVACACPLSAGDYSVRNFKIPVPTEIPNGEYSIKAEFEDEDEETLSCVLLSINVSK
jgi:hypothetical protein